MKTSTKLRIAIMLLMLAAAMCVLAGKSILYGPGFSLTSSYIDALFPAPDSSFRHNFTVYLWFLLASGLAAAVLVWLPGAWAALAACCVCLSSLVYHVIRNIQNDYSIFHIDGVWDFFMLVLPLAAAILCLVLFRAQRTVSQN